MKVSPVTGKIATYCSSRNLHHPAIYVEQLRSKCRREQLAVRFPGSDLVNPADAELIHPGSPPLAAFWCTGSGVVPCTEIVDDDHLCSGMYRLQPH
jgi:hypothetical protein